MPRNIGISFSIGAKLSSTVAAAFSTVEAKLARTKKSMLDASKASKAFEKAIPLRARRDDLIQQVKAGGDAKARTELIKVAAAYREAKAAVLAYGGSVATWAAQQRQANAVLSQGQKRLAVYTAQQQNAAKRDNLKSQVVGTALSAMPLVAPVKAAISFESAMADAAKTIDGMRDDAGNLTPKYHEMETAVLSLGRTLPLTYEQLASLYAAAGQQGMTDIKDLTDFTTLATHMSVAFSMTTDEAADSIGGFRSALHLTIPQARSVLDLMNQFANTTSASEKGIADVVRRIGSLGAVGGVASKPLVALAAVLDAQKVAPEVAATSLKNLFLAFVAGGSATKKQKEAFASLGISTIKLAKAMQKDAPAAILGVLKAIKQLPKYKQLSVMQDIFGKESLAGIAPLLDSLDSVEKNLHIAGDESQYAGAMQKEFEARSKTTANAIVLFKNIVRELGITLGAIFLPALNRILSTAGPYVTAVSRWADAHKTLTTVVLSVAAGLVGLKIAALAVGFAYTAVRGAILGFQTVVLGVRAACAVATGAMGLMKVGTVALTAVTKGAAIAQAVLTAAMAGPLVPIALVVAAVAGIGIAIYALWQQSEGFRNAVTGIWTSIASVVGGVADWISEKISFVVKGFSVFKTVASDLMGSVGSFFGKKTETKIAAEQTSTPASSGVSPAAATPRASVPQVPSFSPAPPSGKKGDVTNNLKQDFAMPFSFSINGMPAGEFAQGVMNVVRSHSGDIEKLISGFVSQQMRESVANAQ